MMLDRFAIAKRSPSNSLKCETVSNSKLEVLVSSFANDESFLIIVQQHAVEVWWQAVRAIRLIICLFEYCMVVYVCRFFNQFLACNCIGECFKACRVMSEFGSQWRTEM